MTGLTTIAVATYGVTDPADVWQIGLNRTWRFWNGATSALLVTTLLWPRYAREEFLEAGRAALHTISKLVSMHLDAYVRRKEIPVEVEQIHRAFGERLNEAFATFEKKVSEIRDQGAFSSIQALQTLVTRTTELVYRRHILPEITETILRPQFETSN